MANLNRCGAALLCIAALLPQAAAQPGGKVMRIVVPFAAGGAREVLARTFYSELGAALGTTAIIDNPPGAGGAIGTASVDDRDRKSTRLNSSHQIISYAAFCLKKKKILKPTRRS